MTAWWVCVWSLWSKSARKTAKSNYFWTKVLCSSKQVSLSLSKKGVELVVGGFCCFGFWAVVMRRQLKFLCLIEKKKWFSLKSAHFGSKIKTTRSNLHQSAMYWISYCVARFNGYLWTHERILFFLQPLTHLSTTSNFSTEMNSVVFSFPMIEFTVDCCQFKWLTAWRLSRWIKWMREPTLNHVTWLVR